MVTVHVAVDPDRVAATDASSLIPIRLVTSSVKTDASQKIFVVLGRADETVMVKLNTNLPPNVVGGGTSAS